MSLRFAGGLSDEVIMNKKKKPKQEKEQEPAKEEKKPEPKQEPEYRHFTKFMN